MTIWALKGPSSGDYDQEEYAKVLEFLSNSSTENLEKAIEALSSELKKPIGLIAGQDVAKFVLKYGGELIL